MAEHRDSDTAMTHSAWEGTAGEAWDVVVRPVSPWWKLDLKEIWRYRDLLSMLVYRDLTAIYKQTILGPVWVLVQPLLTSIMFAVIFGLMARMALDGYPPLLFYMAAVVPWSFFAVVITKTAATLTANAPLMTKVYFPRLIPPLSTLGSSAFTFLIQLVLFFVFALFYRLSGSFAWAPGAALLWLPVLVLLIMALALGAGLIVAAATTKYRDLAFVIAFAVQLLMYMSPVIFPLAKVQQGSTVRMVVEANPLTPVIEGFRGALLGTYVDWGTLWYPAVAAVVLIVAGVALFKRVERSYADVI
ncbi:MAG: ABC transporter permease [Flavobacteriales bacterium]|jgi:lipopolysaccharide transport system permease protein|nr:ABC transporter permease [Flavobacteriales bacterium]